MKFYLRNHIFKIISRVAEEANVSAFVIGGFREGVLKNEE